MRGPASWGYNGLVRGPAPGGTRRFSEGSSAWGETGDSEEESNDWGRGTEVSKGFNAWWDMGVSEGSSDSGGGTRVSKGSSAWRGTGISVPGLGRPLSTWSGKASKYIGWEGL